jgi:cytidine deaminase
MTPEAVSALIQKAEDAMTHSRAPYSGFKVGAALLADNGTVYAGCNIENPSLMLSTCAERIALLKALSEGAERFSAIAIVSGDGKECFPCGSCRQLLREFAPGITVCVKSDQGVNLFSIDELLPHPFEKE